MFRIALASAVMAVALSFAGLAPASVSSPRKLQDARVGSSKHELVAQKNYSGRVVSHLRGSWRVAPRHATCWSHVPWSKICDHARRRMIAHRWLARLAAERLQRLYPPRPAVVVVDTGGWAEWTCIHGREGATDSNTGNGYYGGLQMDVSFQLAHGAEFYRRWGTANNWPIWAQVTAARRARDSGLGYGPWPNTARACGQL